MRIGRIIAGTLVVALVLAACGSGDHGRSKALSTLNPQLTNAGQPFADPALVKCAKAKVAALSTDRLKALSLNTTPVQSKFISYFTACTESGQGTASLRSQLVTVLASNFSKGNSLPPAYVDCIKRKAEGLSNHAIAQLIPSVTKGSAGEQAQGAVLGKQLGQQCLHDPAVLTVLKQVFVKKVEAALKGSGDSQAFNRCVASKGQAETTATVSTLLQDSLTDSSRAQQAATALGEKWAKECVAAGITP